MKPIVLLILLGVCSTAVNSQPGKLILFENFGDNYRQWSVNTSGDAVYTVSNGKYVMENFDGKLRWSALHVKLDGNSNYTISCLATHNSGVTNTGYGLLFGGLDNDNYFVFDIANTGYYRLYSKSGGTLTYLIDWTKNSYIKPDNYADNSIKVERSSGYWNLYINGNWVNSYKASPFYGDLIGFVKGGNQRIEFDNLEVNGSDPNTSSNNSTVYNSNNSNDNYADGSTFTFSDDFSDVKDDWGDDKDAGILEKKPYTYIDDDDQVLVLRSYKDATIDRSIQFYLDTKATFDISADFDRTSGETDNATCGISLEDPIGKRGYAFYISANGYYAIKQLESGITTGDWKASSYINSGNESNKIEIKSDGSYWSFYVNDHYVGLISSKYIYHPSIYLISNEDQYIEVDDFYVNGRIKK